MRPSRLLAICVCVVVAAIGTTAASWGEDARVWHIGACHVGLDHTPPHLPVLRAKLAELGYVSGQNLQFDFRNLADEAAAEDAARAFVALKVDLMLAFEDQCALAMHRVTTKIPIVFAAVTNPVAAGFVRSLARPGTNMTGSILWVIDPAKQVELLKEVDPALKRLLVLFDPSDPIQDDAHSRISMAARNLAVEPLERPGSTPTEIKAAFQSIGAVTGDAVIIASTTARNKFSKQVLDLALRHHVAFVAHRREWVVEGALFSYGPDVAGSGVDVAVYVDKVLRGADPATLPVEQPARFQLVVNAKTAKSLGLTIPPAFLARADEVIE